MYKIFKYRLYPTPKQAVRFNDVLGLCRHLYNAALQERREAWKKNRIRVFYSQQSSQLPAIKMECPEYQDLYSQISQDVLRRLDKAFALFFGRFKGGRFYGYPRFKSYNRYNSFTYPQCGFKIEDNKLYLSKIGTIKIRLHRPIEGDIKTLSVKREGNKWYAILLITTEAKILPVSNKAVGIDMGIESFLITSDNEFISNPRFLRQAEDKLTKAQRILSRRRKGSNRRKKAARIVVNYHTKIRNARSDFHHKVARGLVDTYGFIALEKLGIRNMVKNHSLAKSISDVGWGQFISIVQDKAEEAGREVVLVNPRGTSQICSGCGGIVPKSFSERWHSCPSCGLYLHRDINASRNILRLGFDLQVNPEKLLSSSMQSSHVKCIHHALQQESGGV